MKKILFYSEGWGLGGIETFIMNAIRELPRDKYQCDVFCTHDWSDAHDEELASLGARRYCVFRGHKPNQLKRLTKSPQEFRKLLRVNKYDVVHICTMNGMGFLYSHVARQEGVPVRIVHSHNSDFGQGHRGIKTVFHNIGKLLWKNTATHLVACSAEAGKYLFDTSPFLLIPNGLDTNRYRYNADARAQLRDELGIPENAVLLGAVGRIAEAKQPLFQVDILKELRHSGVNAYLLLVGSGPLESSVREHAEKQGLTDYVRLPGSASDPAGYYSTLDVFTMPSLFEGFGLTILEASSSGLPCFISAKVPNLPYPLEQVQRVQSNNAQEWASAIPKMLVQGENKLREHAADEINNAGYGVETMVKKLITIYK